MNQGRSKEDKKNAQLVKKMKEEELRLLFNDGISNQFGKKKSTAAENAKAIGVTETIIDLDNLEIGDSSESEDDSENIQPIYVNELVPETVEIFREKTLEDIIEEQRAKLAAEGKVGTPVTEASFAVWYCYLCTFFNGDNNNDNNTRRAEKLLKKQAEAEARLKAEQMKRKGGKGLCK